VADAQAAHLRGLAHYDSLNKFIAVYLQHLDREDNVTQTLLWQYFTDQELMAMSGQIQSSNAPDLMLTWLKYILPALPHHERQMMFGGMRQMAPPPFVEAALGVAKAVLPTVEGL